jgi:hypothetical protein
MKRIISFLMFAFLLLTPAMAFTLDIGTLSGIDPLYFTSFAALAAVVVPVAGVVNNLLNLRGAWKQYSSWIVAIFLGVIPWFFNWGIFSGVTWYVALVYSLAAALVANGIFDIQLVKEILIALGIEPAKNNRPPL